MGKVNKIFYIYDVALICISVVWVAMLFESTVVNHFIYAMVKHIDLWLTA
ncbi:hypothetical protein [Mangrovibacter phragmitis]|nr:hypothetical protein [Mangrovibacter phragmitis]